MWKFQKLKTELLYNPAIALLGIYPKDTGVLIHRGTFTSMFTAALSTKAKLWKEPKCPSTDDWIKKMWCVCVCVCVCVMYVYVYIYMYNGILFSNEKE